MKKNFSLSKVTLFMLLLLVAVIIYVFAYFMPAQSTMTMLRSETSLYTAESAIYRQYVADVSPLEADIEAIQNQIDELNPTGYINDSTVSFKISDAIQRYRISLTSVSLESVTTFEDHRALPINLTLSGELSNILKFVQHFENDTEGSYLVRGSAIDISGAIANATLVIYLCTPNI